MHACDAEGASARTAMVCFSLSATHLVRCHLPNPFRPFAFSHPITVHTYVQYTCSPTKGGGKPEGEEKKKAAPLLSSASPRRASCTTAPSLNFLSFSLTGHPGHRAQLHHPAGPPAVAREFPLIFFPTGFGGRRRSVLPGTGNLSSRQAPNPSQPSDS
ncbi:hypothetical protein GQ53DRAFT_369267 [Thozetella sp. PMI_491]|nr:hypothetical protein GQ53DRAFT_369267 [Thozetella sp. PMI_491]